MNLLLDTHTFLWVVNDGPLSEMARASFLDINNKLFLSAVSYWEICIKNSIGKLTLAEDWADQFDTEMRANNIHWLPIAKPHARRIIDLPLIHQDPFDRLLIAQALCEDMSILTSDRNIAKYDITTIW